MQCCCCPNKIKDKIYGSVILPLPHSSDRGKRKCKYEIHTKSSNLGLGGASKKHWFHTGGQGATQPQMGGF